MPQKLYPALITLGPDPDCTIQFYDLPEVISEGDTVADAVVHGQEALALALEYRAESGEPIPEPSSAEDVGKKLDEERGPGVNFIQLVAGYLPEPAVRVNVTLPGDLLKRIDVVADNRSAFLAEAVRSVFSRPEAKESSSRFAKALKVHRAKRKDEEGEPGRKKVKKKAKPKLRRRA